MPSCPVCALTIENEMCLQHNADGVLVNKTLGPDWAEGNRAICDFIHRRRVRPSKPMTDEEWEVFLRGCDFPEDSGL